MADGNVFKGVMHVLPVFGISHLLLSIKGMSAIDLFILIIKVIKVARL